MSGVRDVTRVERRLNGGRKRGDSALEVRLRQDRDESWEVTGSRGSLSFGFGESGYSKRDGGEVGGEDEWRWDEVGSRNEKEFTRFVCGWGPGNVDDNDERLCKKGIQRCPERGSRD